MKRWSLAGLCLVLAVSFATLGVWQAERLVWKRDLIERVNARVSAAPRPAPQGVVSRADDEYLRVRATGRFLHDHETRVQAVTELGAGWWVITPLQTASGMIFVNRGFTPPDQADPATRRSGAPDGPVTVTGLLRMTEPKGGFLRANDPGGGRWYSRDVDAIAKSRGLAEVAPYFIDADATPNPGGYPMGGLTVITFRNSHLAYALTWFGLAFLSLIGLTIVVRQQTQR